MAITINLTPDIEQRLDDLIAQTGRSKEFYLREMIERGMEDIEDYYLAAGAIERVRRGEEPVYTSEEVKKRLGLDSGVH